MTRSAPRVTCWCFDAAEFRPQLPAFERLLSADELARAGRFVLDEKRLEYIVARAKLRMILSNVTGTPAQGLAFAYNTAGKPELERSRGLFFNVSHSRGRIAVAVGLGTEVGVDIERVRDEGDWTGLARRYFTAAEALHVTSAPAGERSRAFFSVWTRKEAYVKALGKGLSLALDSFRVPLPTTNHGAPTAIEDGTGAWHVWSPNVGEGYVAACVCYAGARLQ